MKQLIRGVQTIGGVVSLLLAVAFILWSTQPLRKIQKMRSSVHQHVMVVSRINRALKQLHRLEGELEQKTPRAPAAFLRTWNQHRHVFQQISAKVSAPELRAQLQHSAALLDKHARTPTQLSPQNWREIRRSLRRVESLAAAQKKLHRGRLRNLSIRLNQMWDQLTFIVWIACILAALIAVMFLLGQQNLRHQERITRELERSQERYKLFAQGANDGLWDLDLRTNKLSLSERWKALLGYEHGQLGETPDVWFSLIHPEDKAQFESKWKAHLAGTTEAFECEHRLQTAQEDYLWVMCRGVALRDGQRAYRIGGSLTNITGRESFRDVLTGLPNRRQLLQQLDRLLHRSHRNESYLFAVLFLDLDKFKQVNDTLGHLVGDQLLLVIARRLEECMRSNDLVARLGGDEFAVLLDDLRSKHDATRVAMRIISRIQQPVIIEGHELHPSTSVGIAFHTSQEQTAEALLNQADTAMYQAKQSGRGRFAMFDQEMQQRVTDRLSLEEALRLAVERKEFTLLYQPIIALETRSMVGAEALLRWQHPSRGLLAPNEFLHVLEEIGLLTQVSSWALREVCQQLATWQAHYPTLQGFPIHVNLSARQFLQKDFLKTLSETLDAHKLQPESLGLEITERLVMGAEEQALTRLEALRELGVRVSIDDFGTGHTSLSYLHQFPLQALKIDKSFVRDIGKDRRREWLIETILKLAQQLQLEVIVEGVESEAQLSYLQRLNCTLAQGYLFARPLTKEDFEAQLQALSEDLNSTS